MRGVNNWYVLTGGPSSGKTTLLAELKKHGHAVVPEAARTVIDRAIKQGIGPEELRKDEKRFQDEVMRLKIDIEAKQPKDVLTFFDRGMHDTVAYFRHYGYEIDDWIQEACRTSTYRKVFLLEPLAVYEQDYARTEDTSFHRHIFDLLGKAYEEAGQTVVRIPPVTVAERLDIILNDAKKMVTV